MSLLQKLKAGTKNSKRIKFPGTDQEILMRVLSTAEHQQAVFNAEQRFNLKNIEVKMHTIDAFQSEITTQNLFIALRDPENPENTIATSVDEFRKMLTEEEQDFFAGEYNKLEKEFSPQLMELNQEELNKLLEEVKKNPEETIGNISNTVTLKKLITSLVKPPQS